MKKNFVPKVFILDCDGVLTDGSFYYTAEGKVMKKYGPDDSDALSLLAPYLEIVFVSGDKRGFEITKRRVEDMKYPIYQVSTVKRLEWIKERYNPDEVIYMGDGIFDYLVGKDVGYFISTKGADDDVKTKADYITSRDGGDRAVSEACKHLLIKFFKAWDCSDLPVRAKDKEQTWQV